MRKKLFCIIAAIVLLIPGCSSQPKVKTMPVEKEPIAVGTGGEKAFSSHKTWAYYINNTQVYEVTDTINGIELQQNLEVPEKMKIKYKKRLEKMELEQGEDLAAAFIEANKINDTQENRKLQVFHSISLYGSYVSISSYVNEWQDEENASDATYENREQLLVYDLEKEEVVSLSDLFVNGTDYIHMINEAIREKMKEYSQWRLDEIDLLKRSFTGLQPEEFDFTIYNQWGERYCPLLMIHVKENNRFFPSHTTWPLELNLFHSVMVEDPDNVVSLFEEDAILTGDLEPLLYEWNNLIFMEEDLDLDAGDFQGVKLLQVKEYADAQIKDKLNATLHQENIKWLEELREYGAQENIQPRDMKVSVGFCHTIGPFLEIDLCAYGDEWYQVKNLMIDLANGEKVELKDVVRFEMVVKSMEEQVKYLESPHFSIRADGVIQITEDGEYVELPKEFFDWEKYSNTTMRASGHW